MWTLEQLHNSKGVEGADTRLAIQRERKLLLQNDKADDELVKVSDAAQVFASYAAVFRADVYGRIEGMAAKISKTDTPREVTKIMQTELHEICKSFVDGVLLAISNERQS